MKLCVNYLMEVRELLKEGKIDYIDYIKLYSIDGDLSPFDWCASQRDVMFHGLVGNFSNVAEKTFLNNRDWDLQKKYYEIGKTPYISLHISRYHDEGELESKDEVANTIAKNVKALKDMFGMRVILENVPASRNRTQDHFLANPDYINKVVKENNCGFLFDIGHARVAAEVLNIPFDEYVSRLPMDRLIEVHLAGCMKKNDGTLTANHSKMHEEDYEFIKNAIKNYKTLEVVTLEYGPYREQELEDDCVIVDAKSVNEVAKQEVEEQLSRLKEIIDNN